ncbi:MAG TPA: VOC family protein [Candidatus Dormibacteraeota bacterium]|nr:VOC family protein [Candidatus Dormibacteraeota bacterium]
MPVVPMIAYEDGNAAMDWLIDAFGFVEADRRLDDSGRLTHGELEAGDSIIMLATPTPDYESPKHHREHCEAAARWSLVPYIIDGVLVQVEDLDAHFAQARAAGARILSEIEDTPDGRHYRVEDLEGHRWMFEEVGIKI